MRDGVNVTSGTLPSGGRSEDSATEARRVALLDAAGELLVEGGPEALTVRAIAERAGCSTMVVYSRLGGKAGVVEGLFTEGFRRLAAVMLAGRPNPDPIADLRRCARAYRRFALENPGYYAVMFERVVADFEPSAQAHEVASATLDVLVRKAARAIDAHVFPGGDALDIAACLWAANHGVVSLEIKGIGPPDMRWSKRHVRVIDAVLEGLSAGGAARAQPDRDHPR